MKFKLLKIGSIALAMSLLTLPAKAGEVDFALGITGNFADFDTTGSETEGWGYGDVIAGTETTSTSISKSVDFASAFGEVVFKHGFLGLTWGAEILPGERSLGAKTRTDSSSGADIAAEADTGDNTAKAQVANMLSTYLEPTIYIHDAIKHRKMGTVGYYIGGMKEADLKTSENKTIIVATYAMAAEGLDIKSLTTLLLATPRTNTALERRK